MRFSTRDLVVSQRCETSTDDCVTALRQVKFAWKIQRDMAERGHSLESIKASIEARKPDFDAYIDPQKQKADVIIQVQPLSQLTSCRSAQFFFQSSQAS